MELSELFKEWEDDSNLDPTELGSEEIKIPKLHAKYLRYLATERLALESLKYKLISLKALKVDYYSGRLNEDREVLLEHNWEPYKPMVLKNDIPGKVDSDQEVIKLSLKIGTYNEKVSFLSECMKNINQRNYIIGNAITWKKLMLGN